MAFAKSSRGKPLSGAASAGSAVAVHRVLSTLVLSAMLAACTGLPRPPEVPVSYDFGSLSGDASPVVVGDSRPALVLVGVSASGLSGDAQALQYRQAYATEQRLQPYQIARWSQPPAQLLEQQLRSALQKTRPVLGENLRLSRTEAGVRAPAVLQIDLRSFEQIFENPTASVGHVQVQATLLQSNLDGNTLLGQKVFSIKRPAATPDAVGGAQALAQASKDISLQINEWVTALGQ